MTLTGFPKNHTTQSTMIYLLSSYHYTLTISKRQKRSQHPTSPEQMPVAMPVHLLLDKLLPPEHSANDM